MATRRKEVFLATKVEERNADKAMRIIEGSLKRLQTDHLDLLHIHSLTDRKDLAAIEANDGVLKLLYKLRDQKVARFIGVTSHQQPKYLKMALERDDFDSTQFPLNAGLKDPTEQLKDPAADCFETMVLPVALRKHMGITAMKVFCQDQLRGALKESVVTPETLIRYSMSLPVAAAVIGMPTIEHLEQNVQIAKSFKPMTKEEMQKISGDLAPRYKLAMNRFFENHLPC
jgi:predicted aldo/keto reductase-like oxidoreductase